MQFDESVTFVDYASHPFWQALSDYSFPNNHVFHTLLVNLVTHWLGDTPWAVRLPAFLAGLLILPAVYLLGRSLYNRRVGWLAAALAAGWPVLVEYSANARGYTLVALFTLLIFLLGRYLLHRRNLAAWGWMAFFAALGLFTVPVMVYPIGILFTWLLLSTLWKESAILYRPWQMAGALAGSGFLTLGIAGFFYLPAIIVSGLHALIANEFVRTFQVTDFIAHLPHWGKDIWVKYTLYLPVPTIVFILLGLLLSLVFHRRISRQRVHTLIAALLFLGIILPIQRPEMLSKVFVFIVPLLALWCSAGWVGLVDWFMARRRAWAADVLSAVLACLLLCSGVVLAMPNLPYLYGVKGEPEEVVDWLKTHLQPNDVVVVYYPIDEPVFYYARRSGLNLDQFRFIAERDYQRALILVDSGNHQTLQSVVDGNPLVKHPPDLAKARPIAQIEDITVYEAHP